jgi:hypothetical protein
MTILGSAAVAVAMRCKCPINLQPWVSGWHAVPSISVTQSRGSKFYTVCATSMRELRGVNSHREKPAYSAWLVGVRYAR